MSGQTLGELCAQIAAEHAASVRAEAEAAHGAELTRRLEAYAQALSKLGNDELGASGAETRSR